MDVVLCRGDVQSALSNPPRRRALLEKRRDAFAPFRARTCFRNARGRVFDQRRADFAPGDILHELLARLHRLRTIRAQGGRELLHGFVELVSAHAFGDEAEPEKNDRAAISAKGRG